MKKPTAKVPSDSRIEVRAFAVGKNSLAMIEANTPYNMKLYHSRPLPTTAAMTARGPVLAMLPLPIATCCCIRSPFRGQPMMEDGSPQTDAVIGLSHRDLHFAEICL